VGHLPSLATQLREVLVSHWQIGDVRISKFVEKEFAGNVHRFLLLDATPKIVPPRTTCL
jgi:hypothetical protein